MSLEYHHQIAEREVGGGVRVERGREGKGGGGKKEGGREGREREEGERRKYINSF